MFVLIDDEKVCVVLIFFVHFFAFKSFASSLLVCGGGGAVVVHCNLEITANTAISPTFSFLCGVNENLKIL